MKKNKLLIVDGTAQIFRAFYGIRPLTDPQGQPVNAVYGYTAVMLNLIKQVTPTHLVVAFDRPEPTHRHQSFPDYKAQRQQPPEDLVVQIPVIKNMTEVMRFHGCEQPGLEADDIIATIATQAAQDKSEVIIMTNDKDLFQLVDDRISILRPLRGGAAAYEQLDAAGIKKTFGVAPNHVTDVLALMGDSSDNIPGVPGIGAKTAVELVNTYGSLELIYHHIDQMNKVKLKEKLIVHQALAWQSYQLVQVMKNAELSLDWKTCSTPSGYTKEAVTLMTKLGFKRLLAQIEQQPSAPVQTWFDHFKLLDDCELLYQEAMKNKLISVDCWQGTLLLSAGPQHNCQLALGESTLSAVLQQHPKIVQLLKNETVKKLSYDYKPLLTASYSLKQPFGGEVVDLHLAAHLLDLPANNLERFIERMLGQVPGKEQSGFLSGALIMLADDLMKKLKSAKAWTIYQELELPLIAVLAKMEWVGVAIDIKAVKAMARQFGRELEALEEAIQDLAGVEFNIRSPQQLAEVLFDRLNLAPSKKSKTGHSTSVDVLETLAMQHPLPAKVLDYRKLQKIKSTYLDVLPRLVANDDGRIHTTFNQVGAATGRLSSIDPNLQNIPIRSEIGQKIRSMFIPARPNYQLLAADYSQIELRLLAHLSQDKQMITDFKQGVDIHRAMAAEIFNVGLSDVTTDMRRQAKTCNFGIAYGVSPFGLAKQIGVSLYRAKEFIDQFYSRYPNVRPYLDGTVAMAREKGYVTTLLGRRRATPDIHSANRMVREASERMAINTPIQGSAADLIKRAMINIAQLLESQGWLAKMILQVHDELLFEGPNSEMIELKTMVEQQMSQVYSLSVELVVDATVGDNWRLAHG